MSKRREATYIHGSNAYKLNTYPEYYRQEQEEKKENRKVRPRKAKKTKSRIHYGLLPFSLVTLLTLAACITFLNVQLSISESNTRIVQLEKQLNALKLENRKIEENMNEYIDLNTIYERATNELNMIMPAQDQVNYYIKENMSYTQQYSNITAPKVEEQATLSNVLGFISKGWN